MRYSVLMWVMLFLTFHLSGQIQVTPYDNLPELDYNLKPVWSEEFPSWSMALYSFPVNYNQVVRDGDAWLMANPDERTAILRYYKMWKRALAPYVTNDGSIQLPDLEAIQKRLWDTQMQSLNVKKKIRNDQWTYWGPKETYWLNESGSSHDPDACPWQVNVYCFAVAPSDAAVIYAGTETGFVNKTTDEGQHWNLLAAEYYFGGGIAAIAIDPNNADRVFASAGQQVHRSLDGGQTWQPLLVPGSGFSANHLIISPVNTQIVLASATTGVFRSMDGGNTWTRVWTNNSYDLQFMPGNAQEVMVLSKSGSFFSVLISGDGGQTFVAQADFPTNIIDQSGGVLAVSEDDPSLLMVLMLTPDNTPLLYEAQRSGLSWNWILKATGQTTAFPMNNGQGYFDLALEMAPDDAGVVFAGTTTLYKSVDGGAHFTAIGGYSGPFSIHPDIQDLFLQGNGDAWVATDGGMTKTTDNFTSTLNAQSRNSGLIGSDFWGFDQGWNEDVVVGGRYHNGNTALADFYQPKALRMGGAESPTGWVIHGRPRHVAFNDLGNGWILPQQATGAPEGRFLFSKYPNMDEYGGRRGNMVFHPWYYQRIWIGEGNGMWRSDDGGETWDLLYDFGQEIRYFQGSYSNPDILYADVVGSGLMRSEDGGLTWTSKPSLTSGVYGTSYWKGRTWIAVSPTNPDRLYVCLSNGTWSTDIGLVFSSSDAGDTWVDITDDLSLYTKSLVVQPDSVGEDILYLFSNARNGEDATVYYRSPGMDHWESWDNGYPKGTQVNLALPFYRDGKMRVGGNAGVWEVTLVEPDPMPQVMPWLPRSEVNCMYDTLQFEDHSMVLHDGVQWSWDIQPEPLWIDNPSARDPNVVLGASGSYKVTLTLSKNGNNWSRTIENAITATTCPSIDDCDNPAAIPHDDWELLYVDSQEVNYPGLAVMAFDDDPATIWHTRWSTGSDPYPHEMQIDMGRPYTLFSFTILNRQDGPNGRIKDFEIYLSNDNTNWGVPVSTGQWVNTAAPQTVEFEDPLVARYFRLVGLSEVNGNAWSSAAEFNLVGCTDITADIYPVEATDDLKAFPVPTNGNIHVPLPQGNYEFRIVSMDGRMMRTGRILFRGTETVLSMSDLPSGTYLLVFNGEKGEVFRVRVVRY